MNKNTYIEVDMVNEAKQVINCVYEAKGSLREDIVVDILRGVSGSFHQDSDIINYKTFGQLNNTSEEDIRLLINYMVKYGFLFKSNDQNKVLSIRNIEPLKKENAQVIVRRITESISAEETPYVTNVKKESTQNYGEYQAYTMDSKEIVVRAEQTPGKVSFYNYEDLKEYLGNGLSIYNNTVYTPENIDQAERDLKVLRSIKKKLYDKKKELEEAYSLPIETVKKQLDELLNMVKEPMNIIDNMIKENRKLAKKNEIMEYAKRKASVLGEYSDAVLESSSFFNNRWLNATYKEKEWKKDIDDIIQRSLDAFEEIEKTGGDNKSTLRAYYFDRLSMDGAERFIRVATKADTVDSTSENQPVVVPVRDKTDSSVGYKILKIYGTENQMLKMMRALDDLQMKYEEIENGMIR